MSCKIKIIYLLKHFPEKVPENDNKNVEIILRLAAPRTQLSFVIKIQFAIEAGTGVTHAVGFLLDLV